jgi:hypothetical protein
MAKLILSVFMLLFFISTSSAGELQRRGPEVDNCARDGKRADNYSPKDGSELKGFTVFPIEAPVRKGSETRKRDISTEDKEFMDSLHMFLGLDESGTPDCFRQPVDRGSLRGE